MRRLLVLASTIVFLDIAFYSAITPLLPEYADDLDLSRAQAGILSASYAAGTLVAAIPSGFIAMRLGPQRTVVGGMLLLGVSSLCFGLAEDILLLDGSRFMQGISSAMTWSGAFSWMVIRAPVEQRGSVIGTALGAALAGALCGPPLGALASAVGTGPVFGSVLLLSGILAAAALRIPDAREPQSGTIREVGACLAARPVVTASVLVAVPSLMFGAISVLVPLRLDELGGGPALIAAGFTAGAALEAVMAPAVGRYTDRAGRLAPFLIGILVCMAAVLILAAATVLGVAVAALIGTAVGAGLCFTPAMTMLSDAAAATGLHQGLAAGLTNLAWASGQVTGGVGGGGIATVTGNAIPFLCVALLLLATAAFARRLGPLLIPRPVTAPD
jgi:MFS family permease